MIVRRFGVSARGLRGEAALWLAPWSPASDRWGLSDMVIVTSGRSRLALLTTHYRDFLVILLSHANLTGREPPSSSRYATPARQTYPGGRVQTNCPRRAMIPGRSSRRRPVEAIRPGFLPRVAAAVSEGVLIS